MIEPRWSGRHVDEYGESWCHWAVFSFSEVESRYAGSEHELVEELFAELGWSEVYRGPGRAFLHAPSARRYGKWIIIRQRGGYDV